MRRGRKMPGNMSGARMTGERWRSMTRAASPISPSDRPPTICMAQTAWARISMPIAWWRINARTGKLIWYFQDVHHDLWDYDICAAPQLITIDHDGKVVQAVAIAGKTGYLYVFDRSQASRYGRSKSGRFPRAMFRASRRGPRSLFRQRRRLFRCTNLRSDDVDPYFMTDQERADWKARIANDNNQGNLYAAFVL